MTEQDEYTFLCGYQRIRKYGSTCDLHSASSNGSRKCSQIIIHDVQPTDTLQSLELKYNSSMFEIKRLNRLWSNNSLHCKTQVSIPIFNETRSAVVTPTQFECIPEHSKSESAKTDSSNEQTNPGESVNDFFKRIDSNVKQTKRAVKKLNKKL
ncbi:LysM and putative peptidoglycan-binding domain-containing protein 1 [Aphelenchoides bicaudatus]|nr:LysM and putative peptidoglycan-binding domain-containing protein 1 [Aphelenchoides bicaudatus]